MTLTQNFAPHGISSLSESARESWKFGPFSSWIKKNFCVPINWSAKRLEFSKIDQRLKVPKGMEGGYFNMLWSLFYSARGIFFKNKQMPLSPSSPTQRPRCEFDESSIFSLFLLLYFLISLFLGSNNIWFIGQWTFIQSWCQSYYTQSKNLL